MKSVFIYCLKDPVTGDVRYVGQTNNLKKRFSAHLKTSAKKKTPLGDWLRSFKGEKPLLVVLHEVAEHEDWAEEERRYISCARAIGMDLVNATDGGEGTSGRESTPEYCAAQRAAWTLERRAAQSARQKGVPRPPSVGAAISAAKKGVPQSLECRAAQSARQKGVPKSPEHCAAMSAARKGVPQSPEARAINSASKKGVPWSPAQREVIGAALKSPEVRAAMSAAKTGVPLTPEHRAALSAATKGVPKGPHSPEHLAAISAAKMGVPWSPARRAAYERGKI